MLLSFRREQSPIKDPDLCLLNKEVTIEKDDDDDDFWLKTCDSFAVQLAETQENKKIKTPIKRKTSKEHHPQLPKRKYTKRIKIETTLESEQTKKLLDLNEDVLKPIEDVKSEKSPVVLEKIIVEDTPIKAIEPLDLNKENQTVLAGQHKTVDALKEKEDKKELLKVKPKKKLFKLKFQKPLIVKEKKIKKEDKKELKTKEIKKETKKELKKGDKKEIKKELKQQKLEKKELTIVKEEKKGPKKEEKRDLKKDQPLDDGNKKELGTKKESKKAIVEAVRKKVAAEKENLSKHNENTTRRSAVEAASKFNPRQSLRRKNSLKDYTFAFDELLDDAFAHLEAVKIPVKRRRKCASPPPNIPVQVASQPPPVVKKPKEKDNETIRMRLRSRNRPLLTKQEPKQTASKLKKKKKAIMTNKNIPKQRRRKKSLGEKSAHPVSAETGATTDDWKDEVYKFKRSLRLPSKLISVVSPPGAARPDQVSLTSIMNIPPPAADTKLTSQTVTTAGKNGKTKRLVGAHHLFGRRDAFKGRRMMKREKIVSAEKLMRRKRRLQVDVEDEEKKEESVVSNAIKTSTTPATAEEIIAEKKDDNVDTANTKPPKRLMFKRKFMRKKFRSGFDYIKKKKKKEPASEKKPVVIAPAVSVFVKSPDCTPRYVSEIQADIKGWIVNKGHGETVLHRAARLGVKVSFCLVFILLIFV